MRREGKVVQRWWFNTHMIQLVKERNPEKAGKASDHWFFAFCRRYGVALRRKTHTAQKAPEQLRNTIMKFHSKILREQKRGKYEDCDTANMDQTPLPFVLDDGKSYDSTGAKEVWCSNASSGLDKRQCTVQLTIFADGVWRVRPTIIFRGQGKRISPNKKRSWDSRVNAMFQPKAWCDENLMKVWVEGEWGNMFTNPPRANLSGKILVADVHRAQQTDEVRQLLQTKKTLLINIPPGCTSRVQPLDVSVNKPFKDAVRTQFEKHLNGNLTLYTQGKILASEQRVVLTRWVENAWDHICSNTEMVKRSFKKCGINVNIDGSENALVHLEGISEYVMPEADEEFHVDTSTDENETSDEENFELIDAVEAVDTVEVP